MYYYRKLTPAQQAEAIEYRRLHRRPLHSPPHLQFRGKRQYFITGACFEHKHHIGKSHERMTNFEADLLAACEQHAANIYAWCVLPNHYHVLVQTAVLGALTSELGRLHGRTAYDWNGEDKQRGRQVWCNCWDRLIKSHGHYWATVNYIHHNPVEHGYVDHWQEWLWSSAAEFLARVGHERALQIWREFPVLEYGKKWDVD